MRKSETREIDGMSVTTTQLPPRQAFKLAARLFKYVAPALGAMKPTDEVDMASLTPALMGIMRELDDNELDILLGKVFAGTMVVRTNDKGTPQKCDLSNPDYIDLAFDGKLGSMLAVMKFAIEVNFGDFFAETAPSAAAVTTSK